MRRVAMCGDTLVESVTWKISLRWPSVRSKFKALRNKAPDRVHETCFGDSGFFSGRVWWVLTERKRVGRSSVEVCLA